LVQAYVTIKSSGQAWFTHFHQYFIIKRPILHGPCSFSPKNFINPTPNPHRNPAQQQQKKLSNLILQPKSSSLFSSISQRHPFPCSSPLFIKNKLRYLKPFSHPSYEFFFAAALLLFLSDLWFCRKLFIFVMPLVVRLLPAIRPRSLLLLAFFLLLLKKLFSSLARALFYFQPELNYNNKCGWLTDLVTELAGWLGGLFIFFCNFWEEIGAARWWFDFWIYLTVF
jgi:hypothetical protein